MKKKRTPPSDHILDQLRFDPGLGRAAIIQQLNELLTARVRFVGDVKQIAERFGLHYLRSKRMRKRELVQWILDNHPDVLAAER